MFSSLKPAVKLVLVAALVAAAHALPSLASAYLPAPQQPAQAAVLVNLDGTVERDGKDVSIDNLQVRPGETITWNMRVANRGNQGARNVRAEGLIPKGTAYGPASAEGSGVSVEYALDGGSTFSPRPVVRDAEGRERPAPTDSYTNVRFTWPSEIRPGDVKTAQYKTRLR